MVKTPQHGFFGFHLLFSVLKIKLDVFWKERGRRKTNTKYWLFWRRINADNFPKKTDEFIHWRAKPQAVKINRFLGFHLPFSVLKNQLDVFWPQKRQREEKQKTFLVTGFPSRVFETRMAVALWVEYSGCWLRLQQNIDQPSRFSPFKALWNYTFFYLSWHPCLFLRDKMLAKFVADNFFGNNKTFRGTIFFWIGYNQLMTQRWCWRYFYPFRTQGPIP